MCSAMKNEVARAILLSLLLVSGLNQANGLCLLETVGAVVGGAATVALAPAALGAVGFGAGGIAAGSLAAKAMSLAATTGVGAGVVGTLQSVGAAGLGTIGSAVVGAAGSAIGKMVGSTQCDDDSSGKECH